MALPLPYKIVEPPDPMEGLDADAIQGNFEWIAQQFPLSRKSQSIETPAAVGGTGAPAFENSWVNFDVTTNQGLRFWKDPMGLVHIEGLVKSGTIGATIFTLPAGYRPDKAHVFVVISNGAIGRCDVTATGQVVAMAGNNTYFSLSGINFKQES